jgi:hypothetical protein
MGWPCSTNGEKRNSYMLLVGYPELVTTTRKGKEWRGGSIILRWILE